MSRLAADCPQCGSTAYSDGEFVLTDEPCDTCMGRIFKTALDLSRGMEHKRRSLTEPGARVNRDNSYR